MEETKFNFAVTWVFAVLGVVDVIAGVGFALGARRFGLDPSLAFYAGLLFVVMGAGMLFFAWQRGTWRR